MATNAHLRPTPHPRHRREQLTRLVRSRIIAHTGPCTCPPCTCPPAGCDHDWCTCLAHTASAYGDCLRHALNVDQLALDIADSIRHTRALAS